MPNLSRSASDGSDDRCNSAWGHAAGSFGRKTLKSIEKSQFGWVTIGADRDPNPRQFQLFAARICCR
jgi:hypothetical protein